MPDIRKGFGSFGFLILVLSVVMMQGCTELEELRIANRRQAITIRDQMSELDKLRTELDTAAEVNRTYQERIQLDDEVAQSHRVGLERLARSVGGGAVVRDTKEGPVVKFPEEILFDSGLAKLKPAGESALEKVANYLKENMTVSIRVDAHTDDEPIDKSKYLWETNHHLSTERALSVFNYLVSKGMIEEKRVDIAVYGSNRPITSNTDKTVKAQNRRLELLILLPE